MSLTRVLLNIVGFFVLLDGCLGITSPDVSKMLVIKLIEKFHIVIIRIMSFLGSIICAVISYGVITSGPLDKIFADYLLMLGSAFFSILYLILAFTIPANLKESGYIQHLIALPNSRFRIYEAGTLATGLFLVFISVRY